MDKILKVSSRFGTCEWPGTDECPTSRATGEDEFIPYTSQYLSSAMTISKSLNSEGRQGPEGSVDVHSFCGNWVERSTMLLSSFG